MAPEVAAAIARFRAAWDREVRPATRGAAAATLLGALFLAAHGARIGTGRARLLAAVGLAAVVLAWSVSALVARRRRRDLRRIVRETVARTDRPLAEATLRALTLVDRSATDERVGSPALAQLHLGRLLGRASLDRIGERAAAAARRLSTVALACALGALAAVIVEPFRIIEGLDVLVARDGEAPLEIVWLEDVELVAKPPDYLHLPEESVAAFADTAQPRGTTLSVRGRAVREGRRLVLTDGTVEVPFVDDGRGLQSARWTVADDARLFIAARFGGVLVRQPDPQPIRSIPDEAPRVSVVGAPRKLRLLDEPVVPVTYEVTDDHGLREVNLVLRAGSREERRVLSRPGTDAKVDRGGHQLLANDPFFRRTYVPVEVTVEARDNDPISGPKWGKSAPILIVLPQVGEPEALRYQALRRAVEAVTDLLADRMDPYTHAAAPAAQAAHLAREAELQIRAVTAVELALDGDYGGLRLNGRPARLARGQLRLLGAALQAERKKLSGAAHQKLLEQTEDVLLAFDAGLRGLGTRDTRAVAKRLADVADDAAEAAALVRVAAERVRGTQRLEASMEVLAGGGQQLLRLGDLGLDLGEIVQNDLRRMARTKDAGDLVHTELAARDLAARLRTPEPSFGGGGRGVETGSGGPPSPADVDPSEADQEMAAAERELEQLAQDHLSEMGEVADALERAATSGDMEALREEAKKHADAIREAVKELPRKGADPGSAESAAAEAREQAEAMAGALERGDPRGAVQAGKEAVRALREAQRLGEGTGFFPDERAARESGKARPGVEEELAWAESALEQMRQKSSERAKGDLEKSAGDEGKLADRTRELAAKGERGDTSAPQEMLEHLEDAERAMREARRALEQGDGERGLEQQEQAQRLLEMAKGERDGEREGDRDAEGKRDGDGKSMAREADIPDKDKHKGPEAFRRRVMEGLGGSTDPMLREAVKRYAEGLLR